MNKKTTVTITAPNGKTTTGSGDTVILFAVDDIAKVLKGEEEGVNCTITYVGMGIPGSIYSKIIGTMIASLTKNRFKNSIEASYQLSEIADLLKEHSDKLAKEVQDNMGDDEFRKLLLKFLME